MTLNPTNSNVLHITGVPEFQMSDHFTLRPVVFELQVILREVHWMAQSNFEPYKVKCNHICVTSIRNFQISLRFALRPAVFEIEAILKQGHWITQNDLEPNKVKDTSYVILICEFQLSVLSVYAQLGFFSFFFFFFELQSVLRRVHRMTPYDLE